MVNTENGNVTKLTNCSKSDFCIIKLVSYLSENIKFCHNILDSVHGSWTLFDVHQDLVLASISAPNRPPLLLLGRIPSIGNETKVCCLSKKHEIETNDIDRMDSIRRNEYSRTQISQHKMVNCRL